MENGKMHYLENNSASSIPIPEKKTELRIKKMLNVYKVA